MKTFARQAMVIAGVVNSLQEMRRKKCCDLFCGGINFLKNIWTSPDLNIMRWFGYLHLVRLGL